MAAITHPRASPRWPEAGPGWSPRPPLRLVPGSPARHVLAVYRRRRVAAGVVAALALALASVAGWLALVAYAPPPPAANPGVERAPVEPPAPLSAHPAPAGVLVRPGDSLWSIAQRAHPESDPRPIVTRLARTYGSRPLQAGERLAVP